MNCSSGSAFRRSTNLLPEHRILLNFSIITSLKLEGLLRLRGGYVGYTIHVLCCLALFDEKTKYSSPLHRPAAMGCPGLCR